MSKRAGEGFSIQQVATLCHAMDRPVREKKPTKPLNYANIGGKNPKPPVSAPKKRVLDRYHYEAVDTFGGSASFPATQPPPIGPFPQDYYMGGVVEVKKVKVSATGEGSTRCSLTSRRGSQ